MPICRGLAPNQVEVGIIAGRRFSLLLSGGTILTLRDLRKRSTRERASGLQETKPSNIHTTILKGQWTEESARRAVSSWLKLSTTQKAAIDLIVAQNDAMAIGARKAFQELPSEIERERWLKIPFLGCDGVPKTRAVLGPQWIADRHDLYPTQYRPGNRNACRWVAEQETLPERAFTVAASIPPLENLRPAK